MGLTAIPARHARTRRARALIGAMAGKAAATICVHRTARQSCKPPAFSGNVVLAGKPRLETKLHRYPARDGDRRRGPSFMSLRCSAAYPPRASERKPPSCLPRRLTRSRGESVFAKTGGELRNKQKTYRRLAKKQKGSAKRAKAKLRVARLHARIADCRRDFLHKLSTRLINENQVIAIESLAVSNMQKNRCLAKSIGDASWSEFVRQLAYKAHWYGRTLVGIDRWYPSSKRCSDCGHTAPKMPLNIREWACSECGTIHDRDINAARNVLAAGLAVSAHGELLSPVCI
jgi:IS605 OrfB family transposase